MCILCSFVRIFHIWGGGSGFVKTYLYSSFGSGDRAERMSVFECSLAPRFQKYPIMCAIAKIVAKFYTNWSVDLSHFRIFSKGFQIHFDTELTNHV